MMSSAEMADHAMETKLLVDTLRDAVCNPEIHQSTESYWVLLDYIRDRMAALENALSALYTEQSAA